MKFAQATRRCTPAMWRGCACAMWRGCAVIASYAGFAWCAAIAGCATPQVVPIDAPVIFEILASSADPFVVELADQFVPFGRTDAWQIVNGRGQATNDSPFQCISSPTNSYDAQWMLLSIGGDREFISQGVGGELALRAVESPHDDAISIFTPPLMFAAGTMSMGEVRHATSAMRVEWVDGRGERDRGTGERTARVVGAVRIRTPLGEFDTMKVETAFEARLRFATAQRDTTLWITRGLGPIVEQWRERVFVMGVPISNEAGTAVRIATIPRERTTKVPE